MLLGMLTSEAGLVWPRLFLQFHNQVAKRPNNQAFVQHHFLACQNIRAGVAIYCQHLLILLDRQVRQIACVHEHEDSLVAQITEEGVGVVVREEMHGLAFVDNRLVLTPGEESAVEVQQLFLLCGQILRLGQRPAQTTVTTTHVSTSLAVFVALEHLRNDPIDDSRNTDSHISPLLLFQSDQSFHDCSDDSHRDRSQEKAYTPHRRNDKTDRT